MQPVSPFTDVVAAFVAFAIAAGPAAVGLTTAIEWVRGLVLVRFNVALSGQTLIPLSFAGGIGTALLFHLNFIGPLIAAVPALSTQHLGDVAGQVLTGIGIAGASGYWHTKKSANKAIAKGAPQV